MGLEVLVLKARQTFLNLHGVVGGGQGARCKGYGASPYRAVLLVEGRPRALKCGPTGHHAQKSRKGVREVLGWETGIEPATFGATV
jgi:hypothetical protein